MTHRRTHPLKAWRESQRRLDPLTKEPVPITVQMAADANGVRYQVWWAWERYPDESGHKLPERANMLKIYRYTHGQVRPDHFYDLPDLRAEARAAEEDGSERPAALPPVARAPGGGGKSASAPAVSEACPI